LGPRQGDTDYSFTRGMCHGILAVQTAAPFEKPRKCAGCPG
jgi:hypothetical protein